LRFRFRPKSQRILNIFENDQKIKKKLTTGTSFFFGNREKIAIFLAKMISRYFIFWGDFIGHIKKYKKFVVTLAETYDSIFSLYKCIDWIFINGNYFVLFLVVERNKPIENISYSINVMIFSSFKSWPGRGLNWYITKSL